MKSFNVVPHQMRKTTKNHSLDVAKNCEETYSPSNAAAPDAEERVQKIQELS